MRMPFGKEENYGSIPVSNSGLKEVVVGMEKGQHDRLSVVLCTMPSLLPPSPQTWTRELDLMQFVGEVV